MVTASPPDLVRMVYANDKLLKALVTLLAIKDPHLLDELHIVFGAATESGNRIGKADNATWAHIRAELAAVSQLVDDMEQAEADSHDVAREMN